MNSNPCHHDPLPESLSLPDISLPASTALQTHFRKIKSRLPLRQLKTSAQRARRSLLSKAYATPPPSSTNHACDIQTICIYPTVKAGKQAREWFEMAIGTTAPNAHARIEYFNYSLLSHGEICWKSVCERIQPDIILIVGDGGQPLDAGLRNSLRTLLAYRKGNKQLVLFRDLEIEPSMNTLTLLNYISALTFKNHAQLRAMNGNGAPINCYRHPQLLLRRRHYYE